MREGLSLDRPHRNTSDLDRSSVAAPVVSGSLRASHQDLVNRVILVLGSPRSGTTWLGKILDSHPDVLYRHEPDEIVPERPGLGPRQQILAWVGERGVRAATKEPFFRKSWLPPPLGVLRTGLSRALNGTSRLPGAGALVGRVKVPDFLPRGGGHEVRAAIKLVQWDASAAIRVLPHSRCLFILRHPCGHVASVIAGAARNQFKSRNFDADGPFDKAEVMTFAASRGVTPAAFRALPDAGKIAWSWVAFNEAALAGLEGAPNARLVLYEELCARPEPVVRELFDFAGLRWNLQTAGFIDRSTRYEGPEGYFAVMRSSLAAAERWRTTMPAVDQDAVRAVVCPSSLARFWPDLGGSQSA